MKESPSYRLGTAIVAGTILASLAFCLAVVGPQPAPVRAGQELGDRPFSLGSFRLIERSGRMVSDADLADRVWVASFIFTHCPLSCPKITSVMKSLQPRFEGTGVKLVSISVDPTRDTPEVLADYAGRFGADPERWWFLTGPENEVNRLITERFKLGVRTASTDEVKAGAEEFLHSEKLALVNGGGVVGYFDSNDPKAVDDLLNKARKLDHPAPSWAIKLPAVNATLNGTCAALLALGWVLIRTGNSRAHAVTMISAVIVSGLFLTCYLVYHYQVGSVAYRGVGLSRIAYFTVLLSHTVLATFGVVPLVALTLNHALHRRFHHHARVARVTFPIWMYVSVTGVVIYVMLYQLPIASAVATL